MLNKRSLMIIILQPNGGRYIALLILRPGDDIIALIIDLGNKNYFAHTIAAL